jgi:hypothetical protein
MKKPLFRRKLRPGVVVHTCNCRWFTPVILPIRETEIRKIEVQGQPRQIVCKTPFPK